MMAQMVVGQQGSMASWGLNVNSILSYHPTVSHDLFHRVANGTIRIKQGDIKNFTEDGVVFKDGFTISNLDAVVFCTGYHISFPFLDKDIIRCDEETNVVNLFKNIFPPDIPPTIAVIGLIQPLGAIMPIAELQARWCMQIFKGNKGLPSIEDMYEDINNYQQHLKKRYANRPRHTIQVDPWVYSDMIASYIGCLPSLSKNLDIIKLLLFSAIYPPQFRLNGTGAKPEVAKRMLKEFSKQETERPEMEASSHWDD